MRQPEGAAWCARDTALLVATGAMAVPALGAFLLDLTGLTLRTGNVLAISAVQLALLWLLLGRPRRARVSLDFLPPLLVFVLVWLIGLRLAWPSMLPVSTSVDEVNHWLLVDYLVRHGALPHGDEARSLVEMAEYPFGAHLPIALAARWLGVASPYLLHPFATLYLALLAAFAYALVAELGHRWVALVAVPVLLWPAAYTLGAIAHDFFLAQLFGVACLIVAAYWATSRRRIGQAALPPLVLSGVGLLFSYPSLLPIYGAGVALALLRPPTRRGLLAVAAVGAPLALLAAVYLLPRLGTGLDVVRQGGVATAPTLSTLPPLFVLLGLAGLLRASRRCAPLWPLAAFGWVALAQTALFGLLVGVGRELSLYAVEKMFYVLAPLLAVLGAALLVEVLGSAYAPWGRRLQVGGVTAGVVVLALCLVQVTPRLIRPVGDRLPAPALTADLVATASWLRANAPSEAPLYLTPDHLPAYWAEIGLLKRDRTAEALPAFHDRTRPPGAYWAWLASPHAPTYALVTADAPAIAGPEARTLFTAGDAAVLRRSSDAPPAYRWIGDDLVLLAATPSARRLAPGETLQVDVQLGAGASVVGTRALVARVRDWRGELRGETSAVLEPPLPAGHRAALALSLPLDRSLPSGAYRVELVPFRLPTWDALPARAEPRPEAPIVPLSTGPVAVMAPDALPPTDARPRQPIGARFGGQIELMGIDRLERRGDAVELDLLWRAERSPDRDYSVFLHLLDPSGRLVAQADGFPWAGAYPTSAWEPGQPVPDRYRLVVPAGTTGPLRLVAGLYRLDIGERLRTAAADSVELATLPSP